MGTIDDFDRARSLAAAPAPAAVTDTSGSPALRSARRALTELALVAVLFGVYKLGRALVADERSQAFFHAELVRRVEELMHLPSEAAIQASVHSEGLLRLANVYYTGVHFPLMAAFLVWGFARRPLAEYRWARDLLIIQTGAALVVHIVFPLAPPRMFPQWGFVDTMAVYGPSAYDGASGAMANQLAAMPSLHVGWAVLIAYVVARTGPRWLAAIAAAHAAVTVAVVIVTANHWWVDAVVGVALLVLADLVLSRAGRGPAAESA
ncbi:phosphatase PAP2 family protein [Nocardioides sp.]|uniref:phosphatase PAP2 family protein n=1 Tax=Nocardioides sp. TaxID=35761 RepID=UPI0025CF5B05|nr:phosphatase PAP2 family protein [Nocardioides sp.]